jgi:hypothetical protein
VKRHLALLIGLVALLVWAVPASAGDILGFTEEVSPADETNATEPYIDIDRSDGTVWVAWQASGSHVARSDDGGRSFVQTPEFDVFGRDLGDVDIAVGGPTPCMTAVSPTNITLPSGELGLTGGCAPGAHRIYVTSLSRVPPLQVKLAYTDDRGATWTTKDVSGILNPSFIDRPWLAVYPGASAKTDSVYVSYHDFSASQIWVASSHDGGGTFVQTNVFANDPTAEVQSFCNTVPSGLEVDRETGEIYVQWITADPVQNTAGGCNITQTENFHQVWVAHSATGGLTWDAHQVFDGGSTTNTDEIFATLAVDDSGTPGVGGNVYSVFPDNLAGPTTFDIWFTHSSDKGQTWTAPVKVNSDKGTHYFPWMAAGTTGRVDFIWLNSPDYTPTDLEQSRGGSRSPRRRTGRPQCRNSARQPPRAASCTSAGSARTASFARSTTATAISPTRSRSRSTVAGARVSSGPTRAACCTGRRTSRTAA